MQKNKNNWRENFRGRDHFVGVRVSGKIRVTGRTFK
jgi:hypothetical protein